MSLSETGQLTQSFDVVGGTLPAVLFQSHACGGSQKNSDDVLDLFEEAFRATGCKINHDISPSGHCPASYLPFTYFPHGGGQTFSNEILLGASNRTPEQVKISTRHEKVHAIQWANIPALHASPYNQVAPVVLSPESWIMMTILTERDAFTKTAWLTALELDKRPDEALKNQAATETVTPDDIDFSGDDIRASLQKASTVWDRRLKHKAYASDPDTTLLDHYIEQALYAYENSKRLNAPKGRAPVFVRLDTKDILAMGASFGPSLFGDGVLASEFESLPPLRPDLQERLSRLNLRHGISRESDLPAFSEGLGRIGMTPDSFMRQSKSYTHVPGNSRAQPTEQAYEIQTP